MKRLLYIAVWLYAAYRLGPSTLSNWKHQGIVPPTFQLRTLQGLPLSSSDLPKPSVLVFWATWCGPCQIELARLNRMVSAQEIRKEAVLAISSEEDRALLLRTANERGYLFPVLQDVGGEATKALQVQATPTIALLNQEGKVSWMSTGLSPLLEWHVRQHFK